MKRPTDRARQLRNQPTPAEDLLWRYIRQRRCGGAKFSRQMPVGPFIVDFLCREFGLVVEVDGSTHDFSTDYDERRTRFLIAQGYRVIRFTNEDVMRNLEGVVREIEAALPTREPSTAHPGASRLSLPLAGATSGDVHDRLRTRQGGPG